MQEIIWETVEMLMEGLECTLPLSVSVWALISLMRLAMNRRRRFSLMLLVTLCYAALLIWGTCASRVDSVGEFFTWRLPSDWRGMFVNQLSFTDPAQVWHQLMNVLLFMPFGWLLMHSARPARPIWLITAAGFLTSCTVELFQGCHGLCFELSDLITNTLGTAAGCAAFRPSMALWLSARRAVRRRRRARQCGMGG